MSETVPSFDLLTEPWIPGIVDGGELREFTLVELFHSAHRVRTIADPSPVVTCALYRFLEAVLAQALQLTEEVAWSECWSAPAFTSELTAAIREGCAGRLDLFAADRPFYQSSDIPLSVKPKNVKTVGYLAPDASTGTNIAHFDHTGDGQHAFCPVCCAKGLVVLPAFASSGGAGIKPSICGVPPIYVLPLGDSLKASLMLNYMLSDYLSELVSSADPGPLWTGGGVVEHKHEVTTPVGHCQSLTWPARRVRLYPSAGGHCSRCGRDADVLVRQMVFDQGCSRPKEAPTWLDPWAAYRQSDDGAPIPVRPRQERALWRDFPALFLLDPDGRTSRPAVLDQLDDLLDRGCLDPSAPIRFDAFAVRTDMKAKFFEWAHDSFSFPAALVENERSNVSVTAALSACEEVAYDLTAGLRMMHPVMDRESRDANAVRSALGRSISECLRNYWSSLEGVFREWLCDPRLIGTDWHQTEWLDDWCDAVRAHARDAFERALEGFDATADDLRRQERARARFYGGLKKHLGGTP